MPKYTITVTFHPETFEFDTDDHPEAFAPQGDELAEIDATDPEAVLEFIRENEIAENTVDHPDWVPDWDDIKVEPKK